MAHAITVRHNFETAHRLPILGGKCQNLHGHSWWCEVTVSALHMTDGTVVEFGAMKAAIRSWIDTWLDHGAMLGAADPLAEALAMIGSKVFRFGAGEAQSAAERYAAKLPWPTVENVAQLLANVAQDVLESVAHTPSARVTWVKVQETHVNEAIWSAT